MTLLLDTHTCLPLPVTISHALAVLELAHHHRDSFDRLKTKPIEFGR